MFNVSICDDSKYDIDKIKNALGMFLNENMLN